MGQERTVAAVYRGNRIPFADSRLCVLFFVFFLSTLFFVLPAWSQETLQDILKRGYVRDWLVCGPFASDVEGGVAAAARAVTPALGRTDFMESVGGILRLQPTNLMSVRGNEAVWQVAAMAGPVIDFSPFFRNQQEGVAYAACYFQTPQPVALFFHIQSPLNVRMWANGVPFRDIQPAPIEQAGVDRFATELPAGKNLLIFEVPVIALPVLADAAGITERALLCGPYVNRTLLPGKNGFEMAVELKAASRLGNLFYVPALQDTGILSGVQDDVRQEMLFTLFNTAKTHSPQIKLTLTPVPQLVTIVNPTPFQPPTVTLETPAIPPFSALDQVIPVPVSGVSVGQSVQAAITLDNAGELGRFNARVQVVSPSASAKAHIMPGWLTEKAGEISRERVERRIEAVARQTILADQTPNYGFSLGAMEDCLPFFAARPDLAEVLRSQSQPALGESLAGYGYPDERFVPGEVLWRNLVYGRLAARTWLGRAPESLVLWQQPGMAPQTPYLAHSLGLTGIVAGFHQAGLPSLCMFTAPEGSFLPFRHLGQGLSATTPEAFYRDVVIDRRGLLNQGLPVDIMVDQEETPPPSFLAAELNRFNIVHPPIIFDGGAADAFFRDLAVHADAPQYGVRPHSWPMNTAEPGTLMTRPGLREAWNRLETVLRHTETFATFAALLGADYPEQTLDQAWRTLLFWSHPGRLGVGGDDMTLVNAYSDLGNAFEVIGAVQQAALRFIAGQVNTAGTAPGLGRINGVRALMVFNPSPHSRTGVCTLESDLGGIRGISVVDDMDEPVPFLLDRVEYGNQLDLLRARIRFVATEVPGIGYRTYYIRPGGMVAATPIEGRETTLENNLFRVEISPDTGDITQLVLKATGENCISGPSNRVLALKQDAGRIQDGRELWTTGEKTDAGASKPTLRSVKTEFMQSVDVSTPFLGGVLHRVVTLWNGVSWVACETRLEQAKPDGHPAIFVTVDAPESTCRPVMGERFGVTMGRPGRAALDYRTAGLDNPSGAALYPALHWAAATPVDMLRAGDDTGLPLGPTLIITGDAPDLREAAETLLDAWARHGAPCTIEKDLLAKPTFVNPDDTSYPRLDLNSDAALRLVLGGPGDNRHTALLLKGLSAEERKDAAETLDNGGAIVLKDPSVPMQDKPVTAIILGGKDPAATLKIAKEITDSLNAGGDVRLPDPRVFGDVLQPPPTRGVALLFQTGRVAAMDPDGKLVLGWMTLEGTPAAALHETQRIEYAILPFTKDWRQAQAPAMAQDFSNPFLATLAGIQGGEQPRAQAFLSLSDNGLILDTVKPAGFPAANMRAQSQHPRDGVVLRGFEPHGQPWSGAVKCFVPIINASLATPEEEAGMKLSAGENRLAFPVKPFSMASLWIMPSTSVKRTATEILDPLDTTPPTLPACYWRQGMGAAPRGNLPIAVSLQGQLKGDTPQVEAMVTNHMTDATLEGVLFLNASPNWRLDSGPQYYKLAPGESATWPLVMAQESPADGKGGLVAYTYCLGQNWRDVLPESDIKPTVSLSREGAQIRVQIKNPWTIPALGWVDLVVAPSLWDGADTDETVAPRRSPLAIEPGEEQSAVFRLSPGIKDLWAVAKVAVNNTVVYQPLP